jgi:hypothetical protein
VGGVELRGGLLFLGFEVLVHLHGGGFLEDFDENRWFINDSRMSIISEVVNRIEIAGFGGSFV